MEDCRKDGGWTGGRWSPSDQGWSWTTTGVSVWKVLLQHRLAQCYGCSYVFSRDTCLFFLLSFILQDVA